MRQQNPIPGEADADDGRGNTRQPEFPPLRQNGHGAEHEAEFNCQMRQIEPVGLMVNVMVLVVLVFCFLGLFFRHFLVAFTPDDQGAEGLVVLALLVLDREAFIVLLDVRFLRFGLIDVFFPFLDRAVANGIAIRTLRIKLGAGDRFLRIVDPCALGLVKGERVARADLVGRRLGIEPIRVTLILQGFIVLAVSDQTNGRENGRDDRHAHSDAHGERVGPVRGMFGLLESFVRLTHIRESLRQRM